MTVSTGLPLVLLVSRFVTWGAPVSSGGVGIQPRTGNGAPNGRRVLRICLAASTTITVLFVPAVARVAWS